MKIIATTLNAHDANWYDGETHYIAERHSRNKKNVAWGDFANWYDDHFEPQFKSRGDSIFAFTYTKGGLKGMDDETRYPKELLVDHWKDIENFNRTYNNLWDYYLEDGVYYIDHHQSHGAYAFITSQFEEADVLAIDGGGVEHTCCYYNSKDHSMQDLSGDLSLGWLWNISSVAAGLVPGEEGKLMGLAGYGKVNEWWYNWLEIYVEEAKTRGRKYHVDQDIMRKLVKEKLSNADVAATIQQFTYDKIEEFLFPLKTSENICVAGGVAYNGYMNEFLTTHWKNVYVPPAPGDEGQSLGSYIHADYMLNKNKHIPKLYAGIEHPDNFKGKPLDIKVVAETIANGGIVGWYQGRSESGNRALGNRSILADPRNPDIKDLINSKIKLREDWRPFAPSVLIEHYQDWFDTNQPAPYMSRIMKVKSDKIPGVTHVDGTARIQTVTKEINERYHQLITNFYEITGVPMVLNTSFNCREPIVETPEDAMVTFMKVGIDLLVINDKMIFKHD